MPDLALARSLLFTPGTRPDRFAKAAATRADGLIIDLEDAVGPADKDSARAGVVEWLRQRSGVEKAGFLVCVRINSITLASGMRDLLALTDIARAGHAPDAILLPKVESAAEVDIVTRHLRAAGPAGAGVALAALIESAIGLEAAHAIARSSTALRTLGFGGVDLAADLGCAFEWDALLAHRALLVRAAAGSGLAALDVPYLGIDDAPGLASECARVRALGFTGKLAIHPGQVGTIADAFTPTAGEVENARGVLAAYEAAAGGVCTYRGKMVDEPVVRAARRVLARAG
ncbi:MAG: HpcH/HpaI aldolase/citrate lyase family protein [Burkholderiales bacterium]